MSQAYDLIVIGAGPGGTACAARAHALGLNVALVEADQPGGTCLNRGCIPTKGLLTAPHSEGIAARVAANHVAITALQKGVRQQLKGVTYLQGRARLDGPGRVKIVGHGGITANHVVISSGAQPKPLPDLPFDGERVISSDHALAAQKVPKRMAIVGAGALGVEFAHIYRSYGSQVTLLEAASGMLPAEDLWLGNQLAGAFAANGIDVLTDTQVVRVEVSADEVAIRLKTPGGTQTVDVDQVLVAIGREPNVVDMGLDTVGLPDVGFIAVDGHCRTGVDGLLALGDVTGPPQLAHRASLQGRVAAEWLAGKAPKPVDDYLIPTCVYTHPQLASVGVRGNTPGVVTAEVPLRGNGMARVTNQAVGRVRLVARPDGTLVGAQLSGAGVTEMIGLLGVLIDQRITVADLLDSVCPHPTFSESIWQTAEQLYGRL